MKQQTMLELAGKLNGAAVVSRYIASHGPGVDSNNWDPDQFERWLVGVMRRAIRAPGPGEAVLGLDSMIVEVDLNLKPAIGTRVRVRDLPETHSHVGYEGVITRHGEFEVYAEKPSVPYPADMGVWGHPRVFEVVE